MSKENWVELIAVVFVIAVLGSLVLAAKVALRHAPAVKVNTIVDTLCVGLDCWKVEGDSVLILKFKKIEHIR